MVRCLPYSRMLALASRLNTMTFSQPHKNQSDFHRVTKIKGMPTRLQPRTWIEIAFDQAQDPEDDAADLPTCKPRMNSATGWAESLPCFSMMETIALPIAAASANSVTR